MTRVQRLGSVLLVLLSANGCIPPNRMHLRCQSLGDSPRPLDLMRVADRWHLRNDVELAEEIGVRYGDSRRESEGRTGEHVRQTECTEKLLRETADRHGVTLTTVTALRGSRPILAIVQMRIRIRSACGQRNDCADASADASADACKKGNDAFPDGSAFACVRARRVRPYCPSGRAYHRAQRHWMPTGPASLRRLLRLESRGANLVFREPGTFSFNRLAQSTR